MAKPSYVLTLDDAQWKDAPKTERFVHVNRSQVGVKETSKNSGPEIDRYLKVAGGHPGDPWCAAAQYWCAVKSGFSGADLPKHGLSVFGWWQWANATGRRILMPNLQRGDLYGWLDKDGSMWHGHIGCCAEVLKDKIRGFEGNTNEAGGREGDCYAEKFRTFESFKKHEMFFGIRLEVER